MSSAAEIQNAIVSLDAKIQAEENPATKQAMADDLVRLFELHDAAVGASPAPNPDDIVGELRQKKTDLLGFANAFAAGVNKGVISIADLPFDLINLALDAFGAPQSFRQGPQNLSQGIDWLSNKLTGKRPIAALTTPPEFVDTPLERSAGVIGEYVGSGLGFATAAKELGQRYLARQPVAPGPRGPAGAFAETVAAPGFIRSETAVSGAAGVGGAAGREYLESPIAEVVGSLVTGVPAAATVQYGPELLSFGKRQFNQFSQAGAEERVARGLAGESMDLEQALAALQSNRLLIESVLPEGQRVSTAQLTEDPGIMALLSEAAQNDPAIHNLMSRMTDDASEEIIQQLRVAADAGDSTAFFASLNSLTNDLIDQATRDADLARSQIEKLEASAAPQGDGTPLTEEQLGIDFVSALEASYNRVKQYESQVWSLVDQEIKMDAKGFRAAALALRSELSQRGFNSSQLDFFDDVIRFGAAKADLPEGVEPLDTFEALQRFRSNLLEEQRKSNKAGDRNKASAIQKLNELTMDFIESGPNAETYAAASEVTRTVHGLYNKGKLARYLGIDIEGEKTIDPERAMTRVVRGGTDVGDVRRAIEAEGVQVSDYGQEIPVAEGLTQNIGDMLRLKFSQAKDKKKFMETYAPTLRKFPELARDLNQIIAEIDTAASVVATSEGRAVTAGDKKIISMAALIGADPRDGYSAVSKLSADDLMNINRVAVREGVESGFQNIFIEEIFDRLASTNADGTFRYTRSQILEDKTLGAAFTRVLTPSQRKQIIELDKARSLVTSRTKLKPEGEAVSGLSTSSWIADLLARFLGARVAAEVTTGPAALQAAGALSRTASKFANILPSSQTRRVLVNMIQDPDYMEYLLKLERSNLPDSQKVGQLQTFYRRSGLRGLEEIQRIYRSEAEQQPNPN
jgi:hypothetical protein